MSRGKDSKKKTGDGKHRNETKEERRLRLQGQEEAREACLKIIPFAGGAIFVLLLFFALYVRSIPPATPVPQQTFVDPTVAAAEANLQQQVPDFLKVGVVTPEAEVKPKEPPAETIEL